MSYRSKREVVKNVWVNVWSASQVPLGEGLWQGGRKNERDRTASKPGSLQSGEGTRPSRAPLGGVLSREGCVKETSVLDGVGLWQCNCVR